MQFPVPQFTDVEDKIIGPLTIKQFGIIFGAGILVFLAFSASGKNLLVGAFFLVLFGFPALGLAFGKINGRPLYNSFGLMLRFMTAPKFLVFHKEIPLRGGQVKLKTAQISQGEDANKDAKPVQSTQERLLEVENLLQKQEEEEKQLVNRS